MLLPRKGLTGPSSSSQRLMIDFNFSLWALWSIAGKALTVLFLDLLRSWLGRVLSGTTAALMNEILVLPLRASWYSVSPRKLWRVDPAVYAWGDMTWLAIKSRFLTASWLMGASFLLVAEDCCLALSRRGPRYECCLCIILFQI